MNNTNLTIRTGPDLAYPTDVPFDPGQCFPEWSGAVVGEHANSVYASVRQCLVDLGLDEEHQGTPAWSPLSALVQPGDMVVIKPNLVLNTAQPHLQECTTTHPAVVRPIIDYCWKALKGRGRIIVGDACAAEADFERLVQVTGFKEMVDRLQKRGVSVELLDFRAVKVTAENGIWTGEQPVEKSNVSSQIVNLGTQSLFYDPNGDRRTFHGAGYDIEETNRHHRGDVHEYSVSRTILDADVVISVPKLKTHRKAGITCCLKNLVGINTDKNYLPHFTMGSQNMGGDEMPSIPKRNIWRVRTYNWVRRRVIARAWRFMGWPAARLLRAFRSGAARPTGTPDGMVAPITAPGKDVDLARWVHNLLSGQKVAAGAWSGNETICRMILDLNKIFLCCDAKGQLGGNVTRRMLYVVDAVVSGMGNGPTHPTPCSSQMVAVGWNGLRTDIGLLRLLGIDEECLNLYHLAKQQTWMNEHAEGDALLNGVRCGNSDKLPVSFIEPEGWEFRKWNGA